MCASCQGADPCLVCSICHCFSLSSTASQYLKNCGVDSRKKCSALCVFSFSQLFKNIAVAGNLVYVILRTSEVPLIRYFSF